MINLRNHFATQHRSNKKRSGTLNTARAAAISVLLIFNKSTPLDANDANETCEDDNNSAHDADRRATGGATRLGDVETCGMYLAESSVPGSGFGLYTGTDYSAGEAFGSPDIMIPVFDREFHHDGPDTESLDFDERKLSWILEDEFFESISCAPMHLETYGDNVDCIATSVGMVASNHHALVNADLQYPEVGTGGLSRYSDPSAGAITYYHNTKFTSMKRLEAGTEIFIEYGVKYEIGREDEEMQPLEGDFMWADTTLRRLLNSGLFEADDKTKNTDQYYQLFKDIIRTLDKRKANTLPNNVNELKKANEQGAALYSDQDYIRSMDWLAENGACVDSMEGKLSTIQGAGRGAFLKRSVKKGDVIVTSPVIHFPYNNVMNMYDVQKKKNRNGKDDEIRASGYTADFYDGKKRFFKNRKKGENIIGRQLLVNYCFGHPDSTVLLFPYLGNVGLINHGAEGKSNVKVQWPSSLERGPARKFHRKDWLDSTTEQLADIDKQKPGMMIEIVATRDIEKDEEVFLDYGPAWENVWDDHVRQWKPWSSNKKYVPAQDLNRTPLRGEPLEKVRLEKELREDPYPGANIATGCYLDFNHINILEEVLPDTEEEEEDEKIRRDIINWYQPSSVNFEEILTPANIQPCVIIDRQTVRGKDYYTALISANPIMDPTDNNDLFLFELVNLRAELEVRKIPREAITFIDKPLTSDVHLKGTFRFPIMLPNDIFPEKWKNRKSL